MGATTSETTTALEDLETDLNCFENEIVEDRPMEPAEVLARLVKTEEMRSTAAVVLVFRAASAAAEDPVALEESVTRKVTPTVTLEASRRCSCSWRLAASVTLVKKMLLCEMFKLLEKYAFRVSALPLEKKVEEVKPLMVRAVVTLKSEVAS